MTFAFTTEARAQLRALDRPTALRILETLHRVGVAGQGDVEPLHGEWSGCFRLRVGDFRWRGSDMEVLAVGHRSDVYR